MTVLTQTFTGTDSVATPPTGWASYNGTGSVDQMYLTNRWRIRTNGSYEGGSMSYTAATYTDISFTLTIIHGNPIQGNTYPGLGVRISGGTNGYDPTYVEGHNGYHAWFDTGNNNVHLSQMTGGAYDNEITSVQMPTEMAANGASVKMRLEALGTTVRCKLWLAADVEPGAWLLSTTYTGYASGMIGWRQQPQNAGSTYFDDAVWDDYVASAAGRPAPLMRPSRPRGGLIDATSY